MDVDLLRDGEQFDSFDSADYLDPYPDDGTTLDSIHSLTPNGYEWTLEGEQEINGDIALIPVCDMTLADINDLAPNIDDFHKIMNDWQQLVNVDPGTDFTIEEPILSSKDDSDSSEDKEDILNISTFDITEYLHDVEPTISSNVSPSSSSESSVNIAPRKIKAGMKKMDLQAQKYIIEEDEDDVDVETISECEESSPVLEAKDLKTLLEQFEATQIPHFPENFVSESIPSHIFEETIPVNIKSEVDFTEPVIVKQEIVDDDYTYGYGRRKGTDKKNRKIDKRKKELPKVNVKEQATPPAVKNDPQMPVAVQKEPQPVIIKKEPEAPVIVKKEQQSSVVIKKEQHSPVLIKKEPQSPAPKSPPKSVTAKNVTNMCKPRSISTSPEPVSKINECTQKPPKTPHQSPELPKKLNEAPQTPQKPFSETTQKPPESTTSLTPNKQILDSLPQELIARIKESGKRKTISVIPPMPAKKRGCPRMQEAGAQLSRNKMMKLIVADTVQLDHDYCSVSTTTVEPYPKNPKKDSGFESAEEEERTIIGNQPTVKNADGKLMVSLLKVNTIHANKTIQKKKLNFEEYKRRREGFVKSQNNSQSCSPINSSCSSPLPEDENTRLLKHQEKLMKMAMEVLNTPPKAEKKSEPALVITPPTPIVVPPDMVKKTLVSIGVNTDFKVRRKNLDPLAPVERLDEIKPLLQKASDKINCNSLITSVIENIPKVIDSCDPKHKTPENKDRLEHGEDKTIVYLPKNRICQETRSVECQTNISLIQQTKASRYRRRRESSNSSTSSESSEGSIRGRSTARRQNRNRSSNTSICSSKSSRSIKSNSSSSTYSSRSSSRSRSRSSSPKYSRREKERLKEVEERRVIYVGRVATGTTRDDLKKRFQRFGPITNISLHSRDHSYLDNYGFVTFANKLDAYEAIEHGNDDPWLPKYDLSFGGRRIFCQTSYSDLDNMRDESGYFVHQRGSTDDSFDKLLRELQDRMRKRKA